MKNCGDRVTQERVAVVLKEKGLLGDEDPERQLQRWRKVFGFPYWQDIIALIKELMSPFCPY